jgi:superfamily I DNA/RNA helicase
MCEQSNFIALKEYNGDLFRYLYKAEKLYIDGHYCSIPNKLRSFLEGFLRAVLLTKGYEKKYLTSIKLSDLRQDFQQYYLESYARLNKAVKNLQADGNDGSHNNEIDDKFDEKDTAYQLFENATTLVNFLLSDIYDADIKKKEIFFCESNLPKKESHTNDIQQNEYIPKPQIVVNKNSQQQLAEAETNTNTEIDFTNEQQQIIELTTGKHFLQSPAGSGKTAILTERMKSSIDNYNKEQIICLTFTNKAATKLQQQTYKVLGIQQPFVGTFHSFCLEIIKDSITTIEDDNRKAFLQDFINNFKSNDFSKFDKVLSLGLEEITNQAITKDFIQIDEVQDLSAIQWQIIHQLCHENTHLLVVGDSKQLIYGFRNASNRLLIENTKDYIKHQLKQNHRSNHNIVNILNSYQRQHWPRMPVIQTTDIQAESDTTLLIKYNNLEDELNQNTAIIKQKIALGDTNIAILLRRNDECEQYYQYLQQAGVNCYIAPYDALKVTNNLKYDVLISTIHKVKGLEFNTVFIPQATMDNYWHIKEDDLFLLYVALSRATTNLIVSYTTEDYQSQNGEIKTNQLTKCFELCKNDFNYSNSNIN